MNELEQSLEKLDLQGLLVLNGLIINQALKLVLSAEEITNKFSKPIAKPKLLKVEL